MKHSFKIILTLLVFISSFSLASEPVNQSKVVLDKVEIVGTKINICMVGDTLRSAAR